MRSALIVFIGSGIGGVARHLFNGFVGTVLGTAFPWGILSINVIGSTLIGVVVGLFAFRSDTPAEVRLFLTTGILGGFTTFSAFSLDTALLYERGEPGTAALYVVASVFLSLAGIALGLWVVRNCFS